MLDEVDTAAFAFSSIGAGKAAKATLLFGLENAVALGGVKSFDKVETRFKVGFLGGLVLSHSRPKPGLKSDNVKVFSGFRDTSSFLSAVPTLGVDMFALSARERVSCPKSNCFGGMDVASENCTCPIQSLRH